MSAFVTERISGDHPGDTETNLPDTSRIEMMVALLLPVSSGELRLASAEPDVQPLLNYNYLTAGTEQEKTALLCILGAREDGEKELLAM